MKVRYTPVQTAVRSSRRADRDAIEGSPGLERHAGRVRAAALDDRTGRRRGQARAGDGRVVYVMTDGAALPGRVLAARGRAPRRRPARRMDHVPAGVRRRPRGRDGLDGHARRQGGPGSRRDRRRRRPGQPRHRHHLGRERPRQRQRAERGGRPRRPSDPGAADQLRRRARTSPRGLASLAHDPAGRLPRSHATCRCRRSRTRPSARGMGCAACRRARGAASTRGGRRSARAGRARLPTHRAPFDGTGVDDDPACFLAAGAAGVLAGRLRTEPGAGVPKATPSPASRRPGPRASVRSAPPHPRDTGSRCPPR